MRIYNSVDEFYWEGKGKIFYLVRVGVFNNHEKSCDTFELAQSVATLFKLPF